MNAHQEVATRDAEPVSRELSLVDRAVDAGLPVETITRLIALQHEQELRHAKRAFDAAMSRALANMPTVVKGKPVYSKDGSLRYRYETLNDVTDAVRGPLSDQGLSFRWKTNRTGKDVEVTCIISHEDGHFEETTLPAMIEGPQGTNNVQALGSTITFLQRYTLKAACGIAASEETDGVAPPAPQQRDEPQGPDHNRISPFLQRIVRATDPAGDLRDVYNDAKRELSGEDYEAVKAAVWRKKSELETA